MHHFRSRQHEELVILYQPRVKRDWHDKLKLKLAYNIAHINEGLLRSISEELWEFVEIKEVSILYILPNRTWLTFRVCFPHHPNICIPSAMHLLHAPAPCTSRHTSSMHHASSTMRHALHLMRQTIPTHALCSMTLSFSPCTC